MCSAVSAGLIIRTGMRGNRFGSHSTTGLHQTLNLHFMYSDYKPEFFQKKSMLLYFSPACSICEQQMPSATLSAPVPFIHMTFEVTIDNPTMASLDSSNLPSAENKHC